MARRTAAALLAAAMLVLTACTGGETGTAPGGPDPDSPDTLRVLAGSEVKDMEPLLEEAKKATGVSVVLDYTGTLEGAEQVANGTAAKEHDATWFSSNRYLGLIEGGNQALTTSTKIMTSPVVLGLHGSSAQRLGWDKTPPTWAQIGEAAKSGKFTYGMTNPASSNSGFSALVGVATALSGGGKAIDAKQIASLKPQLTAFFSGQKLTSGSSGWLADRFAEQAGQGVDGIINYESVLLGLQARGLTDPLTLVYPSDGVISGDYPLSLLAAAPQEKRAAFQKLTDWLRTPEAQQRIMQQTHRRPVVPGVAPAAEFGDRLLVELPFPAQRSAADGLISTYLDEVRRPSQTIYVLDTSGSMQGDRLEQLKSAFATLSGHDATRAEGFTRFRERERVSILPFSSGPEELVQYEVPADSPQAVLGKIHDSVAALQAGGDTAVYNSLVAAYEQAEKDVAARPDAFTSIVLMTDGQNTTGIDVHQFLDTYTILPEKVRAVPTFTVLFGESDVEELQQVATLTKGKVFDARSSSLDDVFKEIRGYQ